MGTRRGAIASLVRHQQRTAQPTSAGPIPVGQQIAMMVGSCAARRRRRGRENDGAVEEAGDMAGYRAMSPMLLAGDRRDQVARARPSSVPSVR
jgi:hypothetical protein